MSTKERAPLGFGTELDDFDPSAWQKPKAAPSTDKPKAEAVKVAAVKAAEAAGFKSREPKRAEVAEPAPQRRRRTGRNVQFNLKTRPETIAAFCAIADAKGWGLGETFEYATELLTRDARATRKDS